MDTFTWTVGVDAYAVGQDFRAPFGGIVFR